MWLLRNHIHSRKTLEKVVSLGRGLKEGAIFVEGFGTAKPVP